MKTSKSGLTGVFKMIAWFVAALLLLSSFSAFRASPALGYALVAIPALFWGLAMLNSVRKSVWGLALLMLGLGVLEIYLGAAKGMPISWVLGGAGFFFFLVVRFVKAAVDAYRLAFHKGDLPIPKVSPITHSFDSAFGNNRRRSSSTQTKTNDSGLYDDGFNGRGGVNEIMKEGDPFGEFF